MLHGLDKLQRELKELASASQALDGTITTVKFDPNDPESVQAAIKQVEEAIGSKTAPYQANRLVMDMAEKLKEKYRQGILEKKSEA